MEQKDITRRIIKVTQALEKVASIICVYGPNEYEMTQVTEEFREKLQDACETILFRK